MKTLYVIFFLLAKSSFLNSEEIFQPPNIILINADDLGWNDVSYHGSPEIPTPNIDALALNGVILHNFYGEWMCTPSRAALMTGKYPMRLGLQHGVIRTGQRIGVPLDEVFLPQYLKKLGYDTHIVGKWHLGYQTKEYTPTYRGFDTFFGYLNSVIDYYDYTNYDTTGLTNQPIYYGIDLHNGTTVIRDLRAKYATYVFTDVAKDIISSHDASKPFFLYLPHLAVHAANNYDYLQAPPEVISKFRYIKDVSRRIHAAVTSVLDESVGSIFNALYQKNMLNNSIVVFMSDNGGLVNPSVGGFSSNYPLRGDKATYWEGGLRVPSFIWSPLLNLDQPRISKGLMHVSDWLPTLYSAAGGDAEDLGAIDGIDMWSSIVQDLPSPRTDILHNLDPVLEISAFRLLDFKLVNGTLYSAFNNWHGPTGLEYVNEPSSMYEWVFKNGSVVRDILIDTGMWIAQDPDSVYCGAQVTCEEPPPNTTAPCDTSTAPCLFNISADPCEYTNLANTYSQIVTDIMDIIAVYQKQAVPPLNVIQVDPLADPRCHNFSYVPWLDPENFSYCDYAE